MVFDELCVLAFRGILTAGLLSLGACSGSPKYQLNDGAVYPYGPDNAIVHRLSRLQADGDGMIRGAVVFIEFRDVDGETCRGIGDVEVALLAPEHEPQSKRLNLDSPSENIALWNRAVRMYEVKFQIDPPLKNSSSTAARANLKWTCGKRPAVTDSVRLDALPAQ